MAGDGVTVEVATTNLDRVDAYVDGRPVGSKDVAERPMHVRPVPVPDRGPRELRLEGFQDGTLGAARRLVITTG